MPLTTTSLGAWPKPDGLPLRDWFQTDLGQETYVEDVVNRATDVMQSMDEEAKALFDKATEDIVRLQVDVALIFLLTVRCGARITCITIAAIWPGSTSVN